MHVDIVLALGYEMSSMYLEHRKKLDLAGNQIK